jgi:hypothetical protein
MESPTGAGEPVVAGVNKRRDKKGRAQLDQLLHGSSAGAQQAQVHLSVQ